MIKHNTLPLLAAGWLLVAAACEEDEPTDKPKSTDDAGTKSDAGAGCVKSPKTAQEILNACTESDVESVDKKPDLPLLLKDGGLPPLP